MKINNDNQTIWQAYDRQTVFNKEGGVHHTASAGMNALKLTVAPIAAALPDLAVELAVKSGRVGFWVGVVGFFVGLACDIFQLVVLPFTLVKSAIDVCVHLGKATTNAIEGQSEGSATLTQTAKTTKNTSPIAPIAQPPNVAAALQFPGADALSLGKLLGP